MNKVVWKFPIKEVKMPKGADVLRVGHQNGEPFLWALVAETAPGEEPETETRSFKIYGTGQPVPMKSKWVGSFSVENIVGCLWNWLNGMAITGRTIMEVLLDMPSPKWKR